MWPSLPILLLPSSPCPSFPWCTVSPWIRSQPEAFSSHFSVGLDYIYSFMTLQICLGKGISFLRFLLSEWICCSQTRSSHFIEGHLCIIYIAELSPACLQGAGRQAMHFSALLLSSQMWSWQDKAVWRSLCLIPFAFLGVIPLCAGARQAQHRSSLSSIPRINPPGAGSSVGQGLIFSLRDAERWFSSPESSPLPQNPQCSLGGSHLQQCQYSSLNYSSSFLPDSSCPHCRGICLPSQHLA